MPAFEITALGFDGNTDETDDRILWVWAEDIEWLSASLKGAPWYQQLDVLDERRMSPRDYDFIMPKDVQALHDRLRELAGIPRLDQIVRGMDYLCNRVIPPYRVTFIASDPHDGAYLICKYWDTDKDEQAYIGCEASDLRFLPHTENQKP